MIGFARILLDVLFASIWQGAIVATVAGVLLVIAGRRLSATTRYAALQFALLALVVVPLITTLPAVMSHVEHVSVGGSAGPATANSGAEPGFASLVKRIDIVLGDTAVLALAGAWSIGVLAFALRVALSSLQLSRIRRRSRRLPDRDGIHVFASPDIDVPIAFGLVTPSVLVPASVAARGTEPEFECVLLHELAHVRRRDTWAHAADRALQTLLFFNPAALLLLRGIALERETACDDWAVAQSRDLDAYTRSLATFALRAGCGKASASALGALGFGRATVTRVERLVDARRNGTVCLSHYAIGAFITVLLALAFAFQSLTPAIAFAPSAPAAATAIATSGCSKDASILNPVQPVPAAGTGEITHDSTAVVTVHISASGAVSSAEIYKSSGNPTLDQATLTAAEKSTYSPATLDCKPAAGSYLFRATFQPG